jgi:hypothetical protein
VELVCTVASDGTPCDGLLVNRAAAESCIVSLAFAYDVLNTGTGPVLITELAREFNGNVENILSDRVLVVAPGGSHSESETVEVDLCDDGAKTVVGVRGDSIVVDGVGCSAVAEHTLGLAGAAN